MNRHRLAPTVLVVPALLLFGALVFFGCGSSKGNGICPGNALSCGQRCEGEMPPATCGQACDASNPCPSGFYCGDDGTCTADCLVGGDEFCPNGVCTAQGKCEPLPDAGPPNGDADVDAGPDACARQSVNATAVTPNVVFLIDRSGSMQGELDLDSLECGDPDCNTNGAIPNDCYDSDCNMPALSRWDVLRDVLIGTGGLDTGLIGSLEDQVRFGVAMYTENGGGGCPDMTYAPTSSGDLVVALNNYSAIESIYSAANPGVYTPTGDAVTALVTELDATGVLASSDPTIIILATDGEPGRCSNISDIGSTASRDASVDAVAAAHGQGVRTFVLAVASDSQLDQAHVNALANVGLGFAEGASPAAESWRINSVLDLETAIEGIIQGEISCVVNLEGQVTDWNSDFCAGGTVDFVNGAVHTPVTCSPSNGWQLTSPTTLELFGTACDTLQNTPGLTLEASFPCGTVVPIPG